TRFDCDWSSDVCSSDLQGVRSSPRDAYAHAHATSVRQVGGARLAAVELGDQSHDVQAQAEMRLAVGAGARLPERFEQPPREELRSEERRVGKAWRCEGR